MLASELVSEEAPCAQLGPHDHIGNGQLVAELLCAAEHPMLIGPVMIGHGSSVSSGYDEIG